MRLDLFVTCSPLLLCVTCRGRTVRTVVRLPANRFRLAKRRERSGSFSTGGTNTTRALLNDSGHTAFHSTLSGAGVDVTNDRRFCPKTTAASACGAMGDQAPGMPSGVLYGSVSTARLNDAGQSAFIATLTGSGVDLTTTKASGRIALAV